MRRYVLPALVVAFAFALGWVAHGNPGPGLHVVVRSVALKDRVVALTFDDGPSEKYTPQVLKLLAAARARATFFVIGSEVARLPSLVRAEAAAGDEVGNHGEQHRDVRSATPALLEREIGVVERLIVALTGTRPVLYRPPRGRIDDHILRVLSERGYTVVLWSIDPRDYRGRRPEAVADQVMTEIRPGSVILFHDGGGDRQRTVDALALLLPRLRAAGYETATVSQLIGLAKAPYRQTPAVWFGQPAVASRPAK